MKLIRESVSLFSLSGELNPTHQEPLAKYIESCGRICYQSSHKVGSGSAIKFVNNLIKSGHHSVLEHANVSAKIVTNRGVSLEIIRHRLCAFSQESTRYCNYSGDRFGNELTFIIPVWVTDEIAEYVQKAMPGDGTRCPDQPAYRWFQTLERIEKEYLNILSDGWTPEKAREILPNSLKTELVMTTNLRQWRHVLAQRLDRKCHPQMRYLMSLIAEKFLDSIPIFFEDIVTKDQLINIKEELGNNNEKF